MAKKKASESAASSWWEARSKILAPGAAPAKKPKARKVKAKKAKAKMAKKSKAKKAGKKRRR